MDILLRQWWFWLAVALAGGVMGLAALYTRLFPARPKILAQPGQPGEKLVALLGDSITEGMISSSYVDLLARRMGPAHYRFLNAGVGGDTAYNLLERMDPVLESQPDAAVILVGTNDLSAYLRGGTLPAMYQSMKKLPQAVTVEWYSDLLKRMVENLRQATSARIALCSIPVLGERLDSPSNQGVRRFNAAIKALAEELGVAYLPVYETMEQYLRDHLNGPGREYEEDQSSRLMMGSIWSHNLRGRSWDDISAGNGLVLMTDTIHFNSRGAAIIAGLIEGWLEQSGAVPAQPAKA